MENNTETTPIDNPALSPSLPTYHIFRDKHGIPQFSPKRGTQALKDALIYAFPTQETELQLMQAALRKFFDSERGSKFVFELLQRDLQTSLAKEATQGGASGKSTMSSSLPIQMGKAALRPLGQGSRGGRRGSWSRTSSRASSRPPSRALSRVSSSRAEVGTPVARPETPSEAGMGMGMGIGKITTWVLSSGQEVVGRKKKQAYDPVKRRKVAENRGNVCEKHRASKTAVSSSFWEILFGGIRG